MKDVQAEALCAFDETRASKTVCDVLRRRLSELWKEEVVTCALIIDNRVSKYVDDYTTETLAALNRARLHGSGLAPGQIARYGSSLPTNSALDRLA